MHRTPRSCRSSPARSRHVSRREVQGRRPRPGHGARIKKVDSDDTVKDPDAATWYGPVLAATAGGGVFGDHCRPISDTTVLSSMASQCDHIDHVRTQLPYALLTAGLSVVEYTIIAVGGSLWVALPLAIAPLGLWWVAARKP